MNTREGFEWANVVANRRATPMEPKRGERLDFFLRRLIDSGRSAGVFNDTRIDVTSEDTEETLSQKWFWQQGKKEPNCPYCRGTGKIVP